MKLLIAIVAIGVCLLLVLSCGCSEPSQEHVYVHVDPVEIKPSTESVPGFGVAPDWDPRFGRDTPPPDPGVIYMTRRGGYINNRTYWDVVRVVPGHAETVIGSAYHQGHVKELVERDRRIFKYGSAESTGCESRSPCPCCKECCEQ